MLLIRDQMSVTGLTHLRVAAPQKCVRSCSQLRVLFWPLYRQNVHIVEAVDLCCRQYQTRLTVQLSTRYGMIRPIAALLSISQGCFAW